MTREITDPAGVTWSCVQAFAGLGNDREKDDAARVPGAEDRRFVICTPSGGAKSVRLELPDGWEVSVGDEALLEAIHVRAAEERGGG